MDANNIATTSNRHRQDAKLLVIAAEHNDEISYLQRSDFVEQFTAGDVIVINAAGTLPASFRGVHEATGDEIEIRLVQSLDDQMEQFSRWKAIMFGAGNWRLPTEARTDIPTLQEGDRLLFDENVTATISHISPESHRLLEIEFLLSDEQILYQLFQIGRLIQYSYHEQPLALWDGQTIFSGKPIALEAPSASFMFSWEIVMALKEKGVEVVPLLHAAGISSTGDEHLDNLLPFPEYYSIPERTAAVINRAKSENRRIIALGTSVTRALESSAAECDCVTSGQGIATLLLSRTYQRKIVTGLITGMHDTGTSHLQLLQSFVPQQLLEKAYAKAKQLNYLWHEYGDSCLILA